MNLSDIITIKITDEMIELAKIDASRLRSSIGKNTRAATEDRDLIGSLAHQAVEFAFLKNYYNFTSNRTVQKIDGDEGDIFYGSDNIDVKGTHGKLDEKYFYNKSFLVFEDEISKIKEKGITHFMFVLIDMDKKEAYIFGAISFDDFMENSKSVELDWNNLSIKAYQLKSFNSYILSRGYGNL